MMIQDKMNQLQLDTEPTDDSKQKRDRRRDNRGRRHHLAPPPKVVNSRAALLSDALDSGHSGNGNNVTGNTNNGGGNHSNFKRDGRGGSALLERGDRDSFHHRNPRGPPPVVNERFAQMAEEEREKYHASRRDRLERNTNTNTNTPSSSSLPPPPPPPLQENSRFARAIEEDADYIRNKQDRRTGGGGGAGGGGMSHRSRDHDYLERGPPPVVQNSRFAAAAAEMELEREREMKEREERRAMRGGMMGDYSGRGLSSSSPVPPPLPTVNSRFSRAAADRAMEREQENREREEIRAQRQADWEERQARRSTSAAGGGGGGMGGGGYQRGGTRLEEDDFPILGNTKTIFERPELPKHLQPKKVEEPVLPAVDVPLALPGETEEQARARIEQKKREEEERKLQEQKAEEEAKAKKAAEEAAAAEAAIKAAELEDDLLATFSSGDILGEDLKVWCEEQGVLLPSVEKLVHHLLLTTQKENPDADCAWAEPSKYGTALLSLVSDNLVKQMEILFGIQRFCYDVKFPRVNNEGLVQAMFRGMYKFDLAEPEAFDAWKEDESAEHNDGKGTTIIQTMDWFNWLEEDDEDEDEYEEEEEEEEEY